MLLRIFSTFLMLNKRHDNALFIDKTPLQKEKNSQDQKMEQDDFPAPNQAQIVNLYPIVSWKGVWFDWKYNSKTQHERWDALFQLGGFVFASIMTIVGCMVCIAISVPLCSSQCTSSLAVCSIITSSWLLCYEILWKIPRFHLCPPTREFLMSTKYLRCEFVCVPLISLVGLIQIVVADVVVVILSAHDTDCSVPKLFEYSAFGFLLLAFWISHEILTVLAHASSI